MKLNQINCYEMAGSLVLGGLAARLLTPVSLKHGVAIGLLNGLAVSIASSADKREYRSLYSIGALAIIILAARIAAPRLQGRLDLPKTKALLSIAAPFALYALGKALIKTTIFPSSSGDKDRGKGEEKVHKHKREGYILREVKSSRIRMYRNTVKALSKEPKNNPLYFSVNQVGLLSSFKGVLKLSAEANTQIGQRPSNEDTHVIHTFDDGSSFYGVFDGHGGTQASEIARDHAATLFKEKLSNNGSDVLKAFEETVLDLHEMVTDTSGSTAVMCYFDPKTNKLYTATLADAEANIYREVEGTLKSLPLSPLRNWKTDEKHLPPHSIDKSEQQNPKYFRVPNRFNGINVSRAIGDKEIKLVSQKPKVTAVPLYPGDTLVLCCDGLKDFVPEEDIVNVVSKNQKKSSQELAEALTAASVDSQRRSHWGGDNVTVVVVQVSKGKN